jgi:hypothetical protein
MVCTPLAVDPVPTVEPVNTIEVNDARTILSFCKVFSGKDSFGKEKL